MYKVGIITIVDYTNYGNRLQNYAMQQTLLSRGYRVDTVKNTPPSKYKYTLKNIVRVCAIKAITKYRSINSRERNKNFENFTRTYIRESDFIVSENSRSINELEQYDGFIIGSDQIWNPLFRRNFFLDLLVGINVPKLSIAASFGISQLPPDSISFFKEGLSELDHISVREYEGAEIIKKLIGKDVEVVLDPTMMLTAEEWLQVAKPHRNKPHKKYIMIYALGELSSRAKELIKYLVDKNEYEVVQVGSRHVKKYYSAGPSEFIDYINSAELVITDSFHGIVFSVILNTPFIIFEREDYIGEKSMNSRISTFEKHFNVRDRNLKNIVFEDALKMDFSSISNALIVKRKAFQDYIDEAGKSIEK